jgi:hypothetical protein
MPIIIANILRLAVMSLVSAIPITVAQEFLDGTVKSIVEGIKSVGGITEEEAKDIVVNILVDLAINATLLGTIMKTKIALKTADYLRLTTKGFAKRKLTTQAEVAVAEIATTKSKSTVSFITKAMESTLGKVAAFIWLVSSVANTIEPGIYKPEQTNKVYADLHIPYAFPVSEGVLQPGPFDSAAFKDYAKAIETQNIGGFEYGFPIGSVLYSRQALADLINYVYGKEIIKGNAPSAKDLIPKLAPYLIKSLTVTSTSSTVGQTTSAPLVVPQVQVFTGVLSQGVLGKGLEFTPRPDDLIETAQEMLDAASNLAPWLQSLPTKITYQVKVVSSITSKDGFVQKGSVVQIISGYDSKGQPKYKTVVNKFATLEMYILTDKQQRVKVATIVLGPVDSVKFQVGASTITTIENAISKVVSTTDIRSVTGISTVNPITVTTPPSQVVGATMSPPLAPVGTVISTTPANEQYHFYIGRYGSYEKLLPSTIAGVPGYTEITQQEYERATGQAPQPAGGTTSASFATSTPVPAVSTPAPAISTPVPVAQSVVKKGASATSLNDWYIANGQTLPSLSARATLYQQYGLGQSAYYTGTSEQNTNLLNKLKSL